jgi:hypothetical protein
MISRSPEAGVKVTPRRGPVHLGLVEASGGTGWILLVRFVSTFTVRKPMKMQTDQLASFLRQPSARRF